VTRIGTSPPFDGRHAPPGFDVNAWWDKLDPAGQARALHWRYADPLPAIVVGPLAMLGVMISDAASGGRSWIWHWTDEIRVFLRQKAGDADQTGE
jgi:hypothetical protein